MVEESAGGALWSVITIAGPILLALALLIAIIRNRRSRSEKLESEQAVRDRHDAERRREGLPPKTTPVSAEKN